MAPVASSSDKGRRRCKRSYVGSKPLSMRYKLNVTRADLMTALAASCGVKPRPRSARIPGA